MLIKTNKTKIKENNIINLVMSVTQWPAPDCVPTAWSDCLSRRIPGVCSGRHHSPPCSPVLPAKWRPRGPRLTWTHWNRRAGTEIIYYGWDYYIADTSAYNRSFPCMEATYPYAIKTQQMARNTPSRGLWMPSAVSL